MSDRLELQLARTRLGKTDPYGFVYNYKFLQ